MSDYGEAYEYIERQAARQPFCADEAAHVFAYHDDALTFLRTLPDASVHAVITDPPYGLADHKPERVVEALTAWASGDRERVPTGKGFMGRAWDAFVPPPAVWDECLRVLKPGGHLAVFAGSRTVDLMGLSIRLAGFEMRDGIAAWLYGSGFPKSHDVAKGIDATLLVGKANSRGLADVVAQRPDAGPNPHNAVRGSNAFGRRASIDAGYKTEATQEVGKHNLTGPATAAAREWAGYGTALKPAHEPILLARKPLDGTVAGNVLAHGAGGLNIDACRVAHRDEADLATSLGKNPGRDGETTTSAVYGADRPQQSVNVEGRWPTNVVLAHHPDCGPDEAPGPCVDGCQVAALDAQSGALSVTGKRTNRSREAPVNGTTWGNDNHQSVEYPGDSGGASRFFPAFRYQAKAPKTERPMVDDVGHPTVKPLGLMRWLVRLLVPEGGTVLDPFAGSGATLEAARLEGVRATGVERDEHSCRLIAERLGATTLEPIVGVADPADELLTRVHAAGSVDELMELYRQAVAEQLWCDEIKTVFTARKMAVAS